MAHWQSTAGKASCVRTPLILREVLREISLFPLPHVNYVTILGDHVIGGLVEFRLKLVSRSL